MPCNLQNHDKVSVPMEKVHKPPQGIAFFHLLSVAMLTLILCMARCEARSSLKRQLRLILPDVRAGWRHKSSSLSLTIESSQ